MSSENTAEKLKLGPYLDYVASLPPLHPLPEKGERVG
jgi:hypothetical protein